MIDFRALIKTQPKPHLSSYFVFQNQNNKKAETKSHMRNTLKITFERQTFPQWLFRYFE